MQLEYRRIRLGSEGPASERERAYLDGLLALSRAWADEHCCPAYDANEVTDFLGRDLFVALDGEKVAAYALGDIRTLKEETSYNKVGERAFELDELYVAPAYRSLGVGKRLYRYLESEVRGSVDLIGLTATSYRYEDLLRFYIDGLGMAFNHALLVKRMDG